MTIKIDDLMIENVITAQPHQTMGHARSLMADHGIQSLPVVDGDGQPVGILTSSDFLDPPSEASPISQHMAEKVFTIPRYEGTHIAARMMRNHSIHHLVVIDEKKVVGVLSSYDLLRLVEDHRFVMKNPPTEARKRGGRGKAEG